MRKFYKERSLAYLNPKLAKEWDYEKNYPLTPSDVTYGSNKKVWWKCQKGHMWLASVKTRFHGHKCPYCANKKVCRDNCLATVNPELAKEWHSVKNGKLTPSDVTQYSGKKVWWLCNNKHQYMATIASRSQGWNCPFCSGHKVCRDNCLATINPKLSKEWNYKKNKNVTPHDVTHCSGKKVWWLCKRCGSEWKALISDRKNGTNCPYCAGQKLNNTNCLSITNPKLSKEWNYKKNKNLTPKNIIGGSKRKVWWICEKGHEWKATVHNRNNGSGCPYCNKIELKDGTICDSLVEAYYYLKFKKQKIKFSHHINIGLGRHNCDFYIPSLNKYIEITSYSKQWKYWKKYYKNILRKKKYIKNKLKADFEFVQISLTLKQTQYVRQNEQKRKR